LAQQNLERHKKFRGDCPRTPPWLQAWFQFSKYLAKPTLFDKTK